MRDGLGPRLTPGGAPIRTWFLHHAHQLRGYQSRLVWLGPSLRSWAQDIAQVWRDHIHPGYPIFAHVIRPEPLNDGFASPVLHVLISQGDFMQSDRTGLLLTAHFGTDIHHVAVSAFHQMTPENAIWYANEFQRCSPARDGWACSVFYDNQELAPSTRVQTQHGLNFVIRGTLRADTTTLSPQLSTRMKPVSCRSDKARSAPRQKSA